MREQQAGMAKVLAISQAEQTLKIGAERAAGGERKTPTQPPAIISIPVDTVNRDLVGGDWR